MKKFKNDLEEYTYIARMTSDRIRVLRDKLDRFGGEWHDGMQSFVYKTLKQNELLYGMAVDRIQAIKR